MPAETAALAATVGDEVLDALAGVVAVLATSLQRVEVVTGRVAELRSGRARGSTYSELITGASGPLVVDVLTELLDGLSDVGSRLRRAEARALYAEGMSMEKIGLIMRVSRQRVSAIINSPFGHGASESGQERGRSIGLSLTDPEFRMIAESLPHLAWVAGPDGATEYFNEQGTAYTGMPRETNYRWSWVSMVHPDDQDRAQHGWERATHTDTAFALDYRIRRFDGEYRWHRFRSLPIRGVDGTVVKWIGTAVDIEDQKRLEHTLREAERMASQSLSVLEALAAAPVGFGLVDAEFRVVHMNDHLAAVSGAARNDQRGRPIAEMVPDLWPVLEAPLREVRATKKAIVNLEVWAPEDGGASAKRWLVSSYPVVLEPDVVGTGVVVIDLT